MTLPVASVEFLDQLVSKAKTVRKIGGKGHPKKIGRGDIVSGLLDYLVIATETPDQTNSKEALQHALGLQK